MLILSVDNNFSNLHTLRSRRSVAKRLNEFCLTMDSSSRKMIIFKAPPEATDDDDLYVIALKEAGVDARLIPVLSFEFFDLECLHEKIISPEKYSGLIFTSPRTVRAVALSLGGKKLTECGWTDIYVVGETTARSLKIELGVDGKGSSTGNAAALAPFIITDLQENKKLVNAGSDHLPLLYPCGTLSVEPGGDRLGPALLKGGFHIEAVPAYRTCPHPDTEEHLKTIIKNGIPEIVAFFSPSGVRFVMPLLQKLGIHPQQFKIVAIGPTTEAALKRENLDIWVVADKPTPHHLTKAILSKAN